VDSNPNYRIGEVSTLTGVSTDSIRAWEKRYQAVVPSRDDGNVRLYSEQDVARLKAMQQLVDRGARISDIASLSQEELQQRTARVTVVRDTDLSQEVPLVLIGGKLRQLFEAMPGNEFRIAANLETADEITDAYLPAGATVVVHYDMDAYDRLKRLVQDVFSTGARMVLMLYQFAPAEILEEFRKRGVMTMRMTTDASELRHALLSRHYWDFAGRSERHRFLEEPVPASQLTDVQLVRARNLSTVLACECPAHLAELISALKSFEQYSEQCESRTSEDAATHAMLRSASGHARATMESALLQLAEDDGLLEELLGPAAKAA